MSDELDPNLKRLFAETADYPADEAFVSAVAARTARDWSLALIASRYAIPALSTLAFALAAGGLGLALQQGAQVITTLVTPTPVGVGTGLALTLAGAICVRVLAPLAQRR